MLKAAFVGFGRMGITHFSILNTHPDVKIVAVSDPSTVMQAVLKQYLTVNLYSDYQEMLRQEQPDFIVISTPPDSHAEIIRQAIAAGVHFFVEKPLALDTDESAALVEQLAQTSLVNQVGYVNRFCETFSHVRKLLDAKILGDIKTFSSEMYSATLLKDSSGGWRSKKKGGGGCLYEMTSHAVDILVYFFGAPVAVKGSVMQGIYSSAIDDLVSTTLVYENGATGRITVNWSDASYRKPGNVVTINGTSGKIVVSKYSIKCFLLDDCPQFELRKGWNTIYMADIAEPVPFYLRGSEFTLQLYDFVAHVRDRSATRSSCADAAITDYVLAAIADDAETGSQRPLHGAAIRAATQPRKGLLGRLFS